MALKTNVNYESFKSTVTASHWQRVSTQRRAGVATPLFSLHSKQSIGIGELPDLKLLIDWCTKTSLSIVQLLPMNDVGFRFTPYDAQSSFALDPMYLSLSELVQVDRKRWKPEVEKLRTQFPCEGIHVNYEVKGAKLGLLWKIFQTRDKVSLRFEKFKSEHGDWLQDFVLFKVMKEIFEQAGWESWPEELKTRDPEALKTFQQNHAESLEFQRWLQWQLHEQFVRVKLYASEKNVLLMGDLPFLVAGDSADVWANQNYFKLNLSSGAPPDVYIAKGQRWGMPPYAWSEIAKDDYRYLLSKLAYVQKFYDLFRIDHVVGMFRLWTIDVAEPHENGGLNGVFDPEDEALWNEHGRRLLLKMIENTSMMACAEDLGVIPECCFQTLEEFGLVGMDVQRWSKDWDGDCGFRSPDTYRKNSIGVISTHDMSSLKGWWYFEAGTVDEALFQRRCEERGLDFGMLQNALFDLERSAHGRLRWRDEVSSLDLLLQHFGRPEEEVADFVADYKASYCEQKRFLDFIGLEDSGGDVSFTELTQKALVKIAESSSIFSIQLLQDLLCLEDTLNEDAWYYRINVPGTTGDSNWTLRISVPLEQLTQLSLNSTIKEIQKKAERK